MIHVDQQLEPPDFDAKVRQKGLAFLKKHGAISASAQIDKPTFPPYWRDCLDDLHRLYNGTCAYLAIRFERISGTSVDHFVAKSQRPDLAYEWSNYRLACLTMNARKCDYSEVLDPFAVENGWFHLDLVSGGVFPAPTLPPEIRTQVSQTIARLGLDDSECRSIRVSHFDEFRQSHCDADWLRRWSPFVWQEASRQGLLA